MPKSKGAIIPDPIDPPGTRRMVICVPDTVEWVSLVTGCLVQMTFGWYWDKTTGDWHAVTARARQMYFEFQDQNGLCDVIDCDEIAECIETSENVQDAINTLIQNYGGNEAGRPLTPEQMSAPLSNPQAECDLDLLYGNAVNIVQTTNRNIVDLLETIEAITNNQEAAAELVSFIPILGDVVPVPEFLSIIGKIREWLAEGYEAGYDLDIEIEYICALFCLGQETGCVITTEDAATYFWNRANALPGFEDAFESANSLINALANWQETAGEVVVDVMFAAAFGFLTYLNSIFGMTFAAFVNRTRAGIPNDDWVFNCEECPPVTACFDTESQRAVIISGSWVYDYPEIQFARADANGELSEFDIVFPQNVTLLNFSFETQSLGSGTALDVIKVELWSDVALISTVYNYSAGNGGYVFPGVNTTHNTTGATTVFRRIKFIHEHEGAHRADIRGEVCVEI